MSKKKIVALVTTGIVGLVLGSGCDPRKKKKNKFGAGIMGAVTDLGQTATTSTPDDSIEDCLLASIEDEMQTDALSLPTEEIASISTTDIDGDDMIDGEGDDTDPAAVPSELVVIEGETSETPPDDPNTPVEIDGSTSPADFDADGTEPYVDFRLEPSLPTPAPTIMVDPINSVSPPTDSDATASDAAVIFN